MGWVRRFLKPEVLAPLPLGERYRLQLLVGFMAIGGALSLLSLVVTVTLEGRC